MRLVDVNFIEISSNGRNVRYDGRTLDKCGISGLIRDLAGKPYTLWSVIYWSSVTKKELVDYLVSFM